MSQSNRVAPPGKVKVVTQNDRITKLRLRLMEDGRHQYVIAAEVGVSPGRLSEYALGNRSIPTHRIITFCQVLRCNPDELLGYADTQDDKVRRFK